MTAQTTLFSINGVIDPSKTVWSNIETIAAASAAFITYDPFTQQYGVVINEPGSIVRTITENEIIGDVSISESGFDSLYNSAEVRFANRDVRDKQDYIRYDAPAADRFDFEPDNKLQIESDLINDPVQADVIAITELKQSRQNKVVTFTTDFTHMDLDPGDVVGITLPYWGWDNEPYRIVSMRESDGDNGEILISFDLIEYNADVYNYNGITRYARTMSKDIPDKQVNTGVQTKNDETTGVQVGRALETDVGKTAINEAGVPTFASVDSGFSVSTVDTQFNSGGGVSSTLNVPKAVKNIQIILETANGNVDYNVYIDEAVESRTYLGNVPTFVELNYSTDNVNFTAIKGRFLEWTATGTTFNLTDAAAGYYKMVMVLTNTLDLDQDVPGTVTGISKSVIEITNVATQADADGDAMKLSWIILE